MKTKLIYFAVVLCMVAALVPAIAPAHGVGAVSAITVGPGKMYTTIQAAIDNDTTGRPIIVYPATYNERLTINKPLTVRSYNGPSTTHINGSVYGTSEAVVLINSSGVTLGGDGKGFDIWGCDTGVAVHPTENNSTITGVTVQGNMIHDVEYGIVALAGMDNAMAPMDNQTITDCNFVDNTISYTGISSSGQGIMLSAFETGGTDGNVSDNHVTGNTIYELYSDVSPSVGIYLGSFPGEPFPTGNLTGNVIENNNISYCYTGILGINYNADGNNSFSGNTISGNTVFECNYDEGSCGIELYNEYGDMTDNSIDGNTAYNCSTGIYLDNEDTTVSNLSIDGNTVHDCQGNGIYVYEYGAGMSNISVDGNTAYNCFYGIYLNDDSSFSNSSIDGNTVYGCQDGIRAYGLDGAIISNTTTWSGSPAVGNAFGIYVDYCSYIDVEGSDISYNNMTGLYILKSVDINVISNTVDNNSCGIDVDSSGSINIYGNNIRDNTPSSGIYAHDGWWPFNANCNNIVGNGNGIYAYTDAESGSDYVHAENNWWGDPSGPSGAGFGSGDGAYFGSTVDFANWLGAEIPFNVSVTTAAVPAMISLYNIFWPPEVQNLSSLGPSTADLIVDVSGEGCQECANPDAYYNLSALLLAMLPADFNDSYVSQWPGDLPQDWQEWMDYLGNTEATFSETVGNVSYLGYKLNLADLLFGNTSCEVPDCTLQGFFYEAYNVSSSAMLNELLFSKLRLGQFQVPVTVYNDYGTTVNTSIPLSIVDVQLALDRGWNLRSTPVSLDANVSTWGEISALGAGMPGLQAALTYNAATGWSELTPDTVITPLEAYFINVNESDNISDNMGFVVNRSSSGTPSRSLYSGWNLVGASTNYTYANESMYYMSYPYPAMLVQDAVASVTGNVSVPGWVIAESMPVNIDFGPNFSYMGIDLGWSYDTFFSQWPWTVTADGRLTPYELPYLTPGSGYWLFMENPGILTGDGYTPLPWNVIPVPTPSPTVPPVV